ncbi:MAG: hypothetical protein J6T01_02115 [Kiritimatiellae bacterium]|nr:hypothetical protein [Kiritimatiellia bacterium]
MASRVAHLRELKTEVAGLKAENLALRNELESLRAHFDTALLAAADLRDGEALEIWDGWNLVLGSQRIAHGRDELIGMAKATGRRIWIVFDGPVENVRVNGTVRVSYTGGRGEQRADKFICDFMRMAKYLQLAEKVSVRTNDKDLLSQVGRIVAC